MACPSGDQAGWRSQAAPLVRRVQRRPPASRNQRSPSKDTASRPSVAKTGSRTGGSEVACVTAAAIRRRFMTLGKMETLQEIGDEPAKWKKQGARSKKQESKKQKGCRPLVSTAPSLLASCFLLLASCSSLPPIMPDTDLSSAVEGDDGIFVIRGSPVARSWNGIQYKIGMSSKNVPAKQL